MQQLLQSLGNGKTVLETVPAPVGREGVVVVRTVCSLVSAGTERMLVDFGRAGWLGKVRQQPEKVREVLGKVRANGLRATLAAIRSKLAQPIPLGYCHVGVVVHGGGEFADGDRVVCNGSHAEVVSVSGRLCARIPEGVSDEAAAFTPLAAIALEGIDLLGVGRGDRVVVMGLGLIGQLAVRLLVGRGCEGMGWDPSGERREMARGFGSVIPEGVDLVGAVHGWTGGDGAAGVLITASTKSDEPVSQAARSCRRRGKVVLVGVVGLLLNRADFYRREVAFQVSCSYGERTHVGPGSVRANFGTVLGEMAAGRLRVDDLVTGRYAFGDAPAAYDRLTGDKSALGLVLEYGGGAGEVSGSEVRLGDPLGDGSLVALVGAGNFAVRSLLPAMMGLQPRPRLEVVISNQGYQAMLAARQFGGGRAVTDRFAVFEAGAVFLCTRHDAHAGDAVRYLQAGKSVWVEKPLALTEGDVERVVAVARESGKCLMVGFNRRFAPAAMALRAAVAGKAGRKSFRAVINAGRLDPDHWTLDPKTGGGRIVGEGCHWVDLARYLVGSPVVGVRCVRRDRDGQDGASYELAFADGSGALIDYRTDLPPTVAKEAIELSGDGWRAEIQNWARLRTEGLGGVAWGNRWSKAPQKGHPEALRAFLDACEGRGSAPIPLEEIDEVSRLAVIMQGMREGEEREVDSVRGTV
jgi:predicted dehydrogenase/threonine dehydrogenase-like Zn-dependent dehydrogenase